MCLTRPNVVCVVAMRRRGFERLLRKLVKLPSKPALHYLHVYQPSYMGHSFWLSAEMEIETILQYYSIPTVSARNALYELLVEEAPGFSEAEVHCGVHPNPLGHRCAGGTSLDPSSLECASPANRWNNDMFRM